MEVAIVSGEVRNDLGEGVVWDPDRNSVFWVDIEQSEFWELDRNGNLKLTRAPERIGSFAPRKNGGFIVAFASGFSFWNPATGQREHINHFEAHMPQTRLNDGGTDRQGRFLAGGVDERDRKPISSLCRVDFDLSVHTLVTDISCSNSLCFSPEGDVMYFADTDKRIIWRFAYDNDEGAPHDRRVFATFEDQPGNPDGSCVDADGCLWNAQWGGSRVVRYRPDGKIDRVINVSAPHVSCVVFGGPALDTLYITTARHMMRPEDVAENPLSGALFAVSPGVRGLANAKFGG